MQRLIAKCLLMIVLVAGSFAVAQLVIPPDYEDYLAIIGTKVERLEAGPPPRIVFVGGSNLAFGVDSPTVEKALGYRVVNMGMGFNMGLRFMLDLIEPRIRKGDVVVLVPEYNLFFGLLDGDERLLDVLELYPQGWQYVHSRKQMMNLATNMFRHVKFKVNRVLQQIGRESDPTCVYCPRAFDEHGDITAHLDRPSKDVSRMSFLRQANEVDLEAIDVVNEFAGKVEARGASVVFLFPCLPEPHYELRRGAITRLEAALHERMHVPMPSSAKDYLYPAADFYDWVYHLNRKGRELRTARIIEDLRPAVDAAKREASSRDTGDASSATTAR